MAGKNSDVIVLDCGASMSGKIHGKTKFEIAKNLVKVFMQQKIHLEPKDEVALILTGSEETENEMNEREGGYEHISIMAPLEQPAVQLVKDITKLKPTKKRVDCFDALIIATDYLEKAAPKQGVLKRIFLFTDGGAGVVSESRSLASDIAKVYKELVQEPIVVLVQASDEALQPHEEATKQFLMNFCEEAGGFVLSYEVAMESLQAKRLKRVKQMTKCRADLSLAAGAIEIPVWIYLKSSEVFLPTLKSMSTKGADVQLERIYLRTENDEEGGEAGEEISKLERVRAYQYGKDTIPITPDEEKFLKYDPGERSLKILGAIAQSEIPRQYVTDKAELISAPSPGAPSARVALADLIDALDQLSFALIGRYVYQKGSNPRLVVLTPCKKKGCLYLSVLPYAEDIRELTLKNFPGTSNEQNQAIGQLVDQMILMRHVPLIEEQEEEESPTVKELYKPNNTPNPTLQKFYRLVMERALDPAVKLDQIELDDLNRELDVDPEIKANLKKAEMSKLLHKVFKLQPITSTGKGKKRGWADTFSDKEKTLAPKIDLRSVKVDGEEKAEVQVVQAEAGEAVRAAKRAKFKDMKIGTVHPVQDFRKMLDVKEVDLTTDAFDQLDTIIKRLVVEGGKRLFPKALECIEVMRSAGISECASLRFNQFLESFKQLCHQSEAYQPMWESVVDKALTLISNKDDKESLVTPQQAKAFLSRPSKPLSIPRPAATSSQQQDDHNNELDELE